MYWIQVVITALFEWLAWFRELIISLIRFLFKL